MNTQEKFNCIADLANLGIRYPTMSKNIEKLIEFVALNTHALTTDEVRLGLRSGKVECVKAYKNRTGASLIDAKHACEAYFSECGMEFFKT
jgi:ribosomal protein L7/L12